MSLCTCFFFLFILLPRRAKTNIKRAYEMRNVIYTYEYYTHEYIKEMTRFRAEEKLVFMTAKELEKTGLIIEFI